MPFVAVPHTIEVRLHFTIADSEEMVNVLHFSNPDDVVLDDDVAGEIETAIESAWSANLQPKVHTSVTFDDVTCKDLGGIANPFWREEVGDVGGDAGDMLPFGTALCVTLRSLENSRAGRGRVYLGGFTTSSLDTGDKAAGATAASAREFLNELRTIAVVGGGGGNLLLGVTSKASHTPPGPLGVLNPAVTRPVVSINANRRWDTQRRRGNKIRG